ncbi:hypothetical protein B0J11DRAFT_202600 [Dendryphion nanum]|uniref:NACHT-NTPase and P-loop NTPases N-terminal domain-containing protein n=1 Tax=Dendryphion nanum TaxID=256645 RepID=A0A9P9I8X0_9PLEO|nr:hypothetical protein B0J11DRAFT_202600 [Dendryphion nanum]
MSTTVASTGGIRSLINGICAGLNTAKEDYLDIKDDKNLPPAFSVVAKHLDLVQATLKTAKSHLNDNKPEADQGVRIERALGEGKKKASNLEVLFHSVASNDGTPLLERYPKAASKIGKGIRVELVMKALLEDVKKVAENPAMKKAGMGAQIEVLKKAIEEVSELEPSIVEAAGSGGPTVNVWGGHANSNFGDGKQYISSDNANQYIAEIQHIGGKV